jgi:hypothetical protein
MAPVQRKVMIVTSMGKKYSGMLDVPNESFRTTDLLNSANIFWRTPNEKCYENAILMYDADLYLDKTRVYKRYKKIQIKLPEIVYFYDEFEALGDEMEKKRAMTIAHGGKEPDQQVHIITTMVANSFYDISGLFFGLFRKKSVGNFVALTQVTIQEIFERDGIWKKKELTTPYGFIGVSNNHIESITFE